MSEARQPRAIVLVNGIRVSWLEWEVNNNNFYQADTFRVVLPTKNQQKELTREWWSLQNPIVVEIYVGFPKNVDSYTTNDLTLLIVGEADELPYRMVGGVITLTGRDFSSYMIDTKIIAEDKLNRTASDIATRLAEKYDLNPVVTKTSTTIGRIYEHSFTKMHREISEWDFLCFLAQEEEFQVYVKGYDLHFEPKPETVPVYRLPWKDEDERGVKQFAGKELNFIRNMTIAKDIVVFLRVTSLKGKPFTVKYEVPHNKDKVLNRGKRFYSKPQAIYVHRRAHMDKAKALKEAKAIALRASKHQVRMIAEGLPGNLTVTIDHAIRVTGTGAYDHDYYVDSIVRSFSVNEGFVMSITAKNHDTNTEAPIL